MSPEELRDYVKKLAATEGFDACGIAPAQPIGRTEYVKHWLASGQAGSMEYLHRFLDKRVDPAELLEGARTVIVVALNYHQIAAEKPGEGKVASYAWGKDYHHVIKTKLHRMADRMQADIDLDFGTKACVDTAPLLEREVAALAGIGWIGKNTMVLHQDLGSFFFLGAIVSTLAIAVDTPASDHCGTCRACLDACPTDAFPEPYKMDASRCISYLTIEHRGDITKAYQDLMGNWVFGCDDCQTACPYNNSAPTTNEQQFHSQPHGPTLSLQAIQEWSQDDYRTNLKGSAMKRATLAMLKRNAQIALNNIGPAAE